MLVKDTMTINDEYGEEVVIIIEGDCFPAEPDVGIFHPYVEDVVAYFLEGDACELDIFAKERIAEILLIAYKEME